MILIAQTNVTQIDNNTMISSCKLRYDQEVMSCNFFQKYHLADYQSYMGENLSSDASSWNIELYLTIGKFELSHLILSPMSF